MAEVVRNIYAKLEVTGLQAGLPKRNVTIHYKEAEESRKESLKKAVKEEGGKFGEEFLVGTIDAKFDISKIVNGIKAEEYWKMEDAWIDFQAKKPVLKISPENKKYGTDGFSDEDLKKIEEIMKEAGLSKEDI